VEWLREPKSLHTTQTQLFIHHTHSLGNLQWNTPPFSLFYDYLGFKPFSYHLKSPLKAIACGLFPKFSHPC